MPGKTLPYLSPTEIASHNSEKSCYVTRGSKVYDITPFIDDHPGGGDLILEYAGRDVSEIMEDIPSHEHSEAAYEILDEYLVGFVSHDPAVKMNGNGHAKSSEANGSASKSADRPVYGSTGMSGEDDLSKETDMTADYRTHKFLDLNRPLFSQLWYGGFSKEFYLQQVHRPRHYKGGESAPLFGNFLEPLSKTPWWVVPMLWYPSVTYGAILGYSGLQSVPLTLAYFAAGLFIWTLVEYGMHRCLFHVDGYVLSTVQFYDFSTNLKKQISSR